MLKLVISDNEGTTTVVPFVRDEISIGRKDGNTIRLIERNISRKHCTLERADGAYKIRDHGSYNGVIVNGARIEREAALKAGDQLQIGDYTVLVQDETTVSTPPPRSPPPPPPPSAGLETEPTRVAPTPRPAVAPPRLVVLTAPLAGAEFTLPERGELRLGRAEELEVTIDHRSVSREHARIVVDAGQVRLVDRGSSNGLVVNGERVTDATLAAGDVIELGEVLVRFVAAGETYVFDPAEARRLLRARRGGSRSAVAIAGGIVLVSVLAALWIISDGDDEPGASEPVASNVKPLPAAEASPSAVSEDQRFSELLSSCRAALSGGRFAESMAHAQQALKLRPASSDAAACHTEARAQHEQEQAFVRAKSAYEAGDLAGAQAELEHLMPSTPLAARQDVTALVLSVGEARVAEAEMLLGRDLVRAQDIAGGALKIPMLPSAQRTRAQAVMAKAPEPKEQTAPASRSTPKPRATSEPAAARPAPDRDAKPPIEVASACLAKGDNACVVKALQGKAQSAQELGLLIETYRAMGNTAQAHKHMAVYVQRFPTARRAETYRIMLERQNP
jgi:pSer/pThr/pTyr-binding forkhead associated (FHA) protein